MFQQGTIELTKDYVLFEMLYLILRLLLMSLGCDVGDARERSEVLVDSGCEL